MHTAIFKWQKQLKIVFWFNSSKRIEQKGRHSKSKFRLLSGMNFFDKVVTKFTLYMREREINSHYLFPSASFIYGGTVSALAVPPNLLRANYKKS